MKNVFKNLVFLLFVCITPMHAMEIMDCKTADTDTTDDDIFKRTEEFSRRAAAYQNLRVCSTTSINAPPSETPTHHGQLLPGAAGTPSGTPKAIWSSPPTEQQKNRKKINGRVKSSMHKLKSSEGSKEEKALDRLLSAWECRMADFNPTQTDDVETYATTFAQLYERMRAREEYAQRFAKDFYNHEFTKAYRIQDSTFYKECNACLSQSDVEDVLNNFLQWHDLRQTPDTANELINTTKISQAFKLCYRLFNIRNLFINETNSRVVIHTLLTNDRTKHLFCDQDIVDKMSALAQAPGSATIIEELLIPILKSRHGVSADERLPENLQESLRRLRQNVASRSIQKGLARHGHVANKSIWDVRQLMAYQSNSKAPIPAHQIMPSQESTEDDDTCCCENCCGFCDCCDCWQSLWRPFKGLRCSY